MEKLNKDKIQLEHLLKVLENYKASTKKLNADEIQLGILAQMDRAFKSITTPSTENSIHLQFSIEHNFRGILFSETSNGYGKDLLYPGLEYPILEEEEDMTKSTIGITRYESLAPLLHHYGLHEFTPKELLHFTQLVLLNEKWFRKRYDLFGISYLKKGIVSIKSFNDTGFFSDSLGEMINDVQSVHGFRLSKKERKRYQPY